MSSLGNDLANIRKEKHLTLNDINEATKIPKPILDAIEDGSIFSRIEDDTTYIRGYVLSYGRALSIEKRTIREALDQVEAGTYAGLPTITDEDDKPADETANEENKGKGEKESSNEKKSASGSSENDKTKGSSNKNTQKTSPSTLSQDTEEAKINSIDWARMDQPEKSSGGLAGWIIGIVVLIVAGIILFIYFSWGGKTTQVNTNNPPAVVDTASFGNHSPDLGVGPTVHPDTTDSNSYQLNAKNSTGQKDISTSDTLTFTIKAAKGKLNPVHVYTDLKSKSNPYWIEKGSSRTYSFKNNFRIRGAFQNIVLSVNGFRIYNFREKFFNPQANRVEITRSYLENHEDWQKESADSLR